MQEKVNSCQRKKELRDAYRDYRPDMGVLGVFNNNRKKAFLLPCQNLTARLNRCRMFGVENFYNSSLTADYQARGEGDFTIKVVERLEYEKEQEGQLPKTDYTEDLAALAQLCRERLAAEGYEFY